MKAPIPNKYQGYIDSHDFLEHDGNYYFNYLRKRRNRFLLNLVGISKTGKVILDLNLNNLLQEENLNADNIHLNSINVLGNKMFLSLCGKSEILILDLSSKRISRVSIKNGWRFENDSLKGFSDQHTVLPIDYQTVLMFDNGTQKRNTSRAVIYKLDFKLKRAKLLWEYRAPFKNKFSSCCGSTVLMPSGNVLIGWGAMTNEKSTLFTEVDMQGRLIKSLESDLPVMSYRVNFSPMKSLKR